MYLFNVNQSVTTSKLKGAAVNHGCVQPVSMKKRDQSQVMDTCEQVLLSVWALFLDMKFEMFQLSCDTKQQQTVSKPHTQSALTW